MQSLITAHTFVDPEQVHLEVSGVAYSGGSGNAIARVEVSTDDGESWSDATLKSDEVPDDGSRANFGWVRWSAKVQIDGKTGSKRVCCRATDVEGRTQVRQSVKERGYLYSGFHFVDIEK